MRDESAALQPMLHAVDEVTVAERSKVVSLWHERARRLGLSERFRPDFSSLSRRALSELAEQHRALYLHALPVMELLHQQIRNTHSMVLLTDERGLIMHGLGDGDFLEKAAQVALKPGVLWSEDSKGTNAIGTALAERRDTLVHGSEHFLTVNRFLTCSCSPIRGPRGELIGALDVSGPQEGYHPHTMGLVRISTHMIENQLFIDEFAQSLRIHFHPRTELLGTLLEGIVAFDAAGQMLAANANARALLGLPAEGGAAGSLSALFQIDLPALLAARGTAGTLVRLTLRCGQAVLGRVEPSAHAGRRVAAATEPPRRSAALATAGAPTLADLDTGDPSIGAVIGKLRKVQGHAVPILILGETGTGKELLAHAIHNESERHAGPFIAVDCASLPEPLIEAELFGYEEGAFTGARRRGNAGKIALADGGTLFLDEIGDMPLALQTRLLRVLQERAVLPLGANRERPVNIAVICATHRDLKDMMRRGTFRDDLYYRLNGLTVRLPALRERTDLETLMARMLGAGSLSAPQFTPEVLAVLRRYRWPGNIRQLANVLHTASIMAESGPIGLQQLPEDLLDELRPQGEPAAGPGAARGAEADLKSLRVSAVVGALERNGGNVSAAARSLGVSRNTIYRVLGPQRSA
jgi:transcriptional regulator of acetoin/glycerol metabolism